MNLAKENGDESATEQVPHSLEREQEVAQEGPVEHFHHESPPHPDPMNVDKSEILENKIPSTQTEVAADDGNVELESCPQQRSQTLGDDKSSSKHEIKIEAPADDKLEANEAPGSTAETCAADGTVISTSNLDTVKSIADTRTEPPDVPKNESGHDAVSVPYAGSLDIKAEVASKRELNDGNNKTEMHTPNIKSNSKSKNMFLLDDYHGGSESGTEEEQSAFMKELGNFFRERSMEFRPPKFYGEGVNCLKLWRAVMRLGGYEKVTSSKLWRQVGESFKPPKTCTTVSWTFRGFYEKALLDYERHTISGGELNIPVPSYSDPVSLDNQASGPGRVRRDAAARAMQGWHSLRLLDNGEVSDPIIKDKNSVSSQKREKQFKTLDSLKRKEPSYVEHTVKAARTQSSKPRLDVEVVDIGAPADWVKINVQKNKDCFEIYALVPGLLREEVRVQSDPAGRLVISGEPEHPDNPWGVTPFKKIVSLPSRIDPHQTSAVVTLHGQLLVRVPFEQTDHLQP